MKVVIVEDERPAAERLRRAITDCDPTIKVVAHLQTVADTVRWLSTHSEPDLVFLDVKLTDGLSLEIFQSARITCPVVFTTAYDAYVLDAFECNSIDYLLKPVKPQRLSHALQKYEQLRRHFGGEVAETVRRALEGERRSYKSRLIVQRGASYLSLDIGSIRYGYSKEKTTFLVDREGTQYLCGEALTFLEDVLDPTTFFRLNRKYLVRIEAVASFRPASRGRIKVALEPPPGEAVVVSQAKAGRFRAWMDR